MESKIAISGQPEVDIVKSGYRGVAAGIAFNFMTNIGLTPLVLNNGGEQLASRLIEMTKKPQSLDVVFGLAVFFTDILIGGKVEKWVREKVDPEARPVAKEMTVQLARLTADFILPIIAVNMGSSVVNLLS